MKLKTTFNFYNNDDAPYFGAYAVRSIQKGEPILMFCMSAAIEAIKDEEDKVEAFKDIVLSTLTHEFCHSMQDWLDKELSELEVETILGQYKEKWNVFKAEPNEEDEGMHFLVNDLLEYLDNMNNTDGKSEEYSKGYYDFKEQLLKLFSPLIAWKDAHKENEKNNYEKV